MDVLVFEGHSFLVYETTHRINEYTSFVYEENMYGAVVIFTLLFGLVTSDCNQSPTTTSGTHAPTKICSGELIFEDEFNSLDCSKWQHENTLAGGGNWEFQWYTNNRTNSFVRDGNLFIKPTLTADQLGESALYTSTVDLNGGAPADECTNPAFYGCVRAGTSVHILNPVKSARIRTVNSFSFKYGIVEVRAKMPAGDWLWPAIWLMPRYNAYGFWPASGEIDIVESRGNGDYQQDGKLIGNQLMGSTLHWGPDPLHNKYHKTHWESRNSTGFNNDFHTYKLNWTAESITFSIDDKLIGGIAPPSGGFRGLCRCDNLYNPWENQSIMAPFDQEFYIIINNAVGGISYFPDEAVNVNGKPWLNNSPHAATDFWKNREMWGHTWKLNETDDAALQVDYIKVYAL